MPFDEPVATEIDGVRVWYTDVPGPCMAGLVLRTGAADETLKTSGIDHIVEHLALFPLMGETLDMNGAVTALTTHFTVSGTREDAEAFLSQVCNNLRSLPLDRLDDERTVLETEERGRGGTFAGSASARFGPRGVGLVDWFQFGLRHLGPEDVEKWAADRFTQGQAAVWMTRPPSSALRLELPPGPRLPIPDPEVIPGLIVPSHIHNFGPFIGCSFSATRSLPLFMATRILQERAMATMRLERALTYTVQRFDERIGPSDSLYLLTLDTIDERIVEAVNLFHGLLEGVAQAVSPEEIERAHRTAMPWNATDPARPAAEAARKATASLFGREPTTWKGLEKQGERLTPEKVAAAMREALDTTIFVAPEEIAVPARYEKHPAPPTARPSVEGRLYVRWDGSRRDETVLGPDGITRRIGPEATTMSFDEVEAAVLGPDGTIMLIDRAGANLPLEPNQLRRGKVLASTLADRLADRVVDMHRDIVGWFELQTLADSHDTGSIRSLWQEIEVLARMREPKERILALAIGDMGGRGLVAVTDRRVMHIRISSSAGLSIWEKPRSSISGVQTMSGLLGSKLKIFVRGSWDVQIDGIRPREHAAELEALLAPIEGSEE